MNFLSNFVGISPVILLIILIGLLTIKGLIPFLPFPKEIVMIFSGLYFGLILGSLINITGLLLGGLLDYELAVRGRMLIKNKNERLQKYQDKINKHGWKMLIPLRFSPITAQDVTSFASGFCKIHRNFYYIISISAFAMYGYIFAFLGIYSIKIPFL